jgi:hypothetical protein
MSANVLSHDEARLKAEAEFALPGPEHAQHRQSAEANHRLALEKIAELRALRLAKAAQRLPDDTEKVSYGPREGTPKKKAARKDRHSDLARTAQLDQGERYQGQL